MIVCYHVDRVQCACKLQTNSSLVDYLFTAVTVLLYDTTINALFAILKLINFYANFLLPFEN